MHKESSIIDVECYDTLQREYWMCGAECAAVLFAPSIKRTQQLNEALADVAQLGYGVESAYGCGLVVTYCQLCGFDFQSLVLDEIADESQFFNVFGCV